MLGRKKTPVVEAAPPKVERPGAKNRPTPRRSEKEAARKRPLVQSDRKAAAKAAREQSRLERMKMREAMATGDEKNLPLRDKGPVKRFVRDYVDARWNVGEFFLIIALVAVSLAFLRSETAVLVSNLALWATILMCLMDAWILSRQLKKRLVAKFGVEGLTGGAVRYGVLRAFQIRRIRLPKPVVARGKYPA